MKSLPIFPVLLVGLGLLTGFLVLQKFQALEAREHQTYVTLVIAAEDIQPGTSLERALKEKRLVRIDTVPEAMAMSMRDVLNASQVDPERVIRHAVRRGEFLGQRHLRAPRDRALVDRMRPGHALAAFRVGLESSVGYQVVQGDYVDVYLVRQEQGNATVKKVAAQVLVHAVDARSDADEASAAGQRGRPYRTITFAAPSAQLEALFAAQTLGELTLTWRPGSRPAKAPTSNEDQ